MDVSQIYIIITIVVLAIIAVLIFVMKKNKKEKRITPLAGIAFAFVVAGIVFGDNKLICYGLIGTGIILAVIDSIMQLKKKRRR